MQLQIEVICGNHLKEKIMAKFDSVFKLRGRVGNIVFCKRGGKSYMRALPLEVRNPKTEKQELVRSKFRVAVEFYQRVKETPVRKIWSESAKGIADNGYTLHMKLNMKAFKEDGRVGDFSQIHFAAGKRQCVYNLEGKMDPEGLVELYWNNGTETECTEMDDRLHVIVIHGSREFAPVVVDGVEARRRDEYASFRVGRKGEERVHVYCFFASEEGTEYSNSQYICL